MTALAAPAPVDWVSNGDPLTPMDARTYVGECGTTYVVVRSYYTPNDPGARHWTSATDQAMDGLARRVAPGAHVFLRSSSDFQRLTRADGTTWIHARSSHYTVER